MSYTITDIRQPEPHTLTAENLEGLREALIEYAFTYNRAEIIEANFPEHVEAVYPTDPADVDEDEIITLAAETCTAEDVRNIAGKLWDASSNFIRLTQN